MWKKVLKFLVALVLVATVGLMVGVQEVRYFVGYALFPQTTRDAAFDKYTSPSGAGPVEMPVVTLIARREGIGVAGIDWWSPQWLQGQSTHDRDDKMFQYLRGALPSTGTVLVLTGYAHLLEFRSRYAAAGFTRSGFSGPEKAALFAGAEAPFVFPDGLDRELVRTVGRFIDLAQQADSEALQDIYTKKAARIEAFRETLAVTRGE